MILPFIIFFGFLPEIGVISCGNNTCLVKDDDYSENIQVPSSVDPSDVSEKLSMTTSLNNTENDTETTGEAIMTSTAKPIILGTKPSALPSFINRSSSVSSCFCDLLFNQCDINCCCDVECTSLQKQVFSHCEDYASDPNFQECYATSTFFRYSATSTQSGLFCVVRQNLRSSTDYLARSPIENTDDFDRELKRRRIYRILDKAAAELEFKGISYKTGSILWTVLKGRLVPFRTPAVLLGDRCLSRKNVRYLKNFVSSCTWIPTSRNKCNSPLLAALDVLSSKLVSSPAQFNTSDLDNSIKNCSLVDSCLPFAVSICGDYPSKKSCVRVTKLSERFVDKKCSLLGGVIDFDFTHNGTYGIQNADVFVWLTNSTTITTRITFEWGEGEKSTFSRSGNPGYLLGRPILAGRKLSFSSNDTSIGTFYGIELSTNSTEWLYIIGHSRGKCNSNERTPVLFNENVKSTCSFALQKRYFDKNGCFDLQKSILYHLLDEDFGNSSSTTINKYIGIYGNSRVEVMSDWIQVNADDFHLMSARKSIEFTKHRSACVGVITSLYIDIAIAKFGPNFHAQRKIVGVFYRFGSMREITGHCLKVSCDSTDNFGSVKLTTAVNFFDVSKKPQAKYAQPPSLEIKLPHDFFYPFFSGKGIPISSSILGQLILLSLLCFI